MTASFRAPFSLGRLLDPAQTRRTFGKRYWVRVIANTSDSHLYWERPASSNPPTEEPTMIVCVCRRVSDREIARHARAGMDFDDIQFELGVATQCGQCESCARDIVDQCCASQPVAAMKSVIPLVPVATGN